MLDELTRAAVLKLHAQGLGTRAIAKHVHISRTSVKRVVGSGAVQRPAAKRAWRAEENHEDILRLHQTCKGNLVRVHEELRAGGANVSYQALTGYCRKMGIGYERPRPAGQYHFGPGTEMQHDTSPHDVELGGRKVRVQTASLVLCHSRMMFIQLYPQFTRFWCKVFLTDALKSLGGSAQRCMVDNSNVVVGAGTGSTMVPAPEMAGFSERFGFTFVAHEVGDANRSARVERPFHHVENNFLAGRTFRDFSDLNAQAQQWCDKVNASIKRRLGAAPRDLFAAEQAALRPLPRHIPDVTQLHQRVVDNEGYVNVQTNRYSVPWQLMGRQLEVHETRDAILVLNHGQVVARHTYVWGARDGRFIIPEHRPPRHDGVFAKAARERDMPTAIAGQPLMKSYLDALRERAPHKAPNAARNLERLLQDYPLPALLEAVERALSFGLFDLQRLETMVIKNLQKEFFNIHEDDGDDDG